MKCLKSKLIAAFVLLGFSLFALPDEVKSVYKKILNQNIQSIEYEDEDFSSDRYGEFLRWALDRQLNLNEHRKRRTAFLLFDKLAIKEKLSESFVLNDMQTWKDLTLFCGQNDVKTYFVDKVDRTITMLGRATLYGMLAQPITDIAVLKKRQRIIRELVDNPALLQEIQAALQAFKTYENML